MSFFDRCKGCTDDPFWTEYFEKCSRGKHPKNMKIIGRTVIVYNKKRGEVFSFNGIDDDEKICDFFLDIFRDKLRIFSPTDIKEKEKKLKKIKDELKNRPREWSKIEKMEKKKILLEYALSLKKKYFLSEKEYKDLFYRLMLDLEFKTISESDIEFDENYKILNISTVHPQFVNEEFSEFLIDKEEEVKCVKRCKKTDTNSMGKKLQRYIKNYNSQLIAV